MADYDLAVIGVLWRRSKLGLTMPVQDREALA
jgi:hypothetical protein